MLSGCERKTYSQKGREKKGLTVSCWKRNDNSMVNNNQTYLWPCWARLGPCLLLFLLKRTEKRKRKKQKSCGFNFFSKYCSMTNNLLLLRRTPSWWGRRREGFGCESDIVFTGSTLYQVGHLPAHNAVPGTVYLGWYQVPLLCTPGLSAIYLAVKCTYIFSNVPGTPRYWC